MHPAVLDTDVASLLHQRRLTGPMATRLIGREPLITFITYGELIKWAEIRHWGTRRREELMGWLSIHNYHDLGTEFLPRPGQRAPATPASVPSRRRPHTKFWQTGGISQYAR